MSSDLVRVSRRGDVSVLVLYEQEIQVLQWVFDDLTRVMRGTDPEDAVAARLFPRAYLDPTEEDAEAQWQSLVHDDLVDTRVDAVSEVVRSMAAAAPIAGHRNVREVLLDDEHVAQWVGVVNDARLAIGTTIGVTATSDPAAVNPDDPSFELWVVYDWLTALLASLLGADDDEPDHDLGGDLGDDPV